MEPLGEQAVNMQYGRVGGIGKSVSRLVQGCEGFTVDRQDDVGENRTAHEVHRPRAAGAVLMQLSSMPMMSAGIMSGVNWMRLNSHPRVCDSVRTSSVLPRPGTPMISTWPWAKTAARS